MTVCSEVVIYRIKPGNHRAFLTNHALVQAALKVMPGYVAFQTQVNPMDPCLRMDWVTWESLSYAKTAYENFKTLPTAQAFMALIEEVCFSGHFNKPEEKIPLS